jgi:hypothetical protein
MKRYLALAVTTLALLALAAATLHPFPLCC